LGCCPPRKHGNTKTDANSTKLGGETEKKGENLHAQPKKSNEGERKAISPEFARGEKTD